MSLKTKYTLKVLGGSLVIGLGASLLIKSFAIGTAVAIVGGGAWGAYCAYQQRKELATQKKVDEIITNLMSSMPRILQHMQQQQTVTAN